MRALKRDLDKTLKDHNVSVLGVDEGDGSGWSVLDAFDVMIHLFTPEMRANYDLESLWKDARPIDLEALLAKDKKSSLEIYTHGTDYALIFATIFRQGPIILKLVAERQVEGFIHFARHAHSKLILVFIFLVQRHF